jgi:hypothetical protein
MVNNKRTAILLVLTVLSLTAGAACGTKPEEASAPTFDNVYSEALSTYRDYLLNKTPDRIYAEYYIPYEFAIVDMNDDGIPELIIDSDRTFDILTYKNGHLAYLGHAYTYATLLNNRAVFTESWRWGGFMYTEFDKTGHTSYFRHFINESGEWHYSEKVMPFGLDSPESEVSEEEYNRLFAPYKEYAENNADMIPWMDSGELRSKNSDEYIPISVTEDLDHRPRHENQKYSTLLSNVRDL